MCLEDEVFYGLLRGAIFPGPSAGKKVWACGEVSGICALYSIMSTRHTSLLGLSEHSRVPGMGLALC